ncbi:MAG: hypothetical protein LC128_09400 [Chitinophagales bacterium]|nr:hypothetical protein [Chitinophagales bacterium]
MKRIFATTCVQTIIKWERRDKMKSRTIEIIDNHIKALEEELEWYQQKNIELQDKYDIEKEQLEQERDYLDGRCAALENDLVLDDVVSKLENVQTRLADFENMARAFVEYKAPDHICRMHFDLMLKESEE